MTDAVRIILLAVFGLCLLASGFLSGSETALTAVPRERIHQLAATGKSGRRLQILVDDLEGSISAILVANNFVNILATSLASVIAISLVGEGWGTVLSTLTVTVLVLIFGEVTPKTLAARRPERYGLIAATPIRGLAVGIGPLSRLFVGLGRGILRLLRIERGGGQSITPADIRALAALGEQSGDIDRGERQIIERLFEAADQPVREIMTPRVDIVTLTLPVTSEQVGRAVADTAHSRFPVIGKEGDLDSIQGILYAKDVLQHRRDLSAAEVGETLREPHYAPESAPVMRVLQDLRARRTGMAVVLDEHGGVEGLVTVKDLVGELVGDLADEYDPRHPTLLPIGPQSWIADGGLPIDDLEEAVGEEIEDGPYSTLAGLFFYQYGHIPQPGDQVKYRNLTLTALAMNRRRISKLRVRRLPAPAPSESK